MKKKMNLNLFGAALLLATLVPGPANAQSSATSNTGCRLAQIAFCDTFDAPSPNGIGTRSGDLDGVVWGVSRASQNDNPSQGLLNHWESVRHPACGTASNNAPEHDVTICNGQLTDSVNDGGGVTVLGMYPRQPFDIAGRTGTVVFDLNADSQGSHAAWPAFVYTDQPVPAPYHPAAGLSNLARNSFGFTLDGTGACGASAVTVGSMFTTTNYKAAEQPFSVGGCVKRPTQYGALNHFEVRLSESRVEVWGADPGSNDAHLLATGEFHLPLTRGLIWIEDVHYNANKFDSQGSHTFVWDNVGFDGPTLPRDLGFDVLDARQDNSSAGNLGYLVPAGRSLNLSIPNVSSVEHATAALLEFTWTPHQTASLTYSFNGHAAHSQAWPYGDAELYASHTIALPVPTDELQNGTNTVSISSSDNALGGVTVANIDLILVAAGGNPDAAQPTVSAPTSPAPAAAPSDTPSNPSMAPSESSDEPPAAPSGSAN